MSNKPSRLARFRRPLLWLLPLAIPVLLVGHSACTAMGSNAEGARLQRMKASPQYAEEGFENKIPNTKMGSENPWKLMGRWLFGEEIRTPEKPLPLKPLQTADFSVPPKDGLRLTWLGHSAYIIEMDGYRILSDPALGKRASPVSFAGPERFFDSPIAIEAMPPLDAIIISHDHYDHLDQGSVQKLAAHSKATFFVPLGIGAHLEGWGISAERIIELDWWQEAKIHNLRLISTPARHFSGRSLIDRNSTLWTSWSLIGPKHRVFFSGDTGMFPGFAEIGQRLGPFDATLIESGAYNDMWADVHIGPEQAIAAHKALRGKLFVPIHWGTFQLAMHGWTEPAERLLAAAKDQGVSIAIPIPGESVTPYEPQAIVRWWPKNPWQTAQEAPVVSSGLEAPKVAEQESHGTGSGDQGVSASAL